ncbi:HTH-type transcriptional repressor PurR [Streptomyces alboniger]
MVLTRRPNGHRPTLEDVARRSGVSKSTVSRVINAEPRVRAEVVDRVREVIAELGYVPNQAARQLVTHRTGAVAVVATQPENRLFLDPFFDCLLRGIRRELAHHGAQAVLLFLDEPDDYARVADYLGGGHVDGCGLTPRPQNVHHVKPYSGIRTGNRYDEPMVLDDVSEKTPGTLLVARLHVDLCRLASAIC